MLYEDRIECGVRDNITYRVSGGGADGCLLCALDGRFVHGLSQNLRSLFELGLKHGQKNHLCWVDRPALLGSYRDENIAYFYKAGVTSGLHDRRAVRDRVTLTLKDHLPTDLLRLALSYDS